MHVISLEYLDEEPPWLIELPDGGTEGTNRRLTRLALFTFAQLRVPKTKKRTRSCSMVWLPRKKSIMERSISQINHLRLQSACSTFFPGTEIKSRHTYTHLITVFWSAAKIFA